MSIIGNNILAGASGNQGYEIERSLRFNDGDTAYLNFTPSSAGNQKTWTFSFWMKRTLIQHSSCYIFMPTYGGDGSNECQFGFDGTDKLLILDSGGLRGSLKTTQVFRDVNAWYHIVVALDTTQATASNRLKIYVNGEQVTDFDTETYPSQDVTWGWNAAAQHDFGRYAFYGSNYFDGYMAEVNFIDGQALAPSNFGETDSGTGAWIPKKYSGSYGSQGWYLNFSDNSGVTATTLGKDSSGNGNNWTPNNFSVTAGAGNDSLEDTPTNNWCTLSPINTDNVSTFSNGNLDTVCNNASTSGGSIAVNSGKWYAEVVCTAKTASNAMVGICTIDGFDGERQVDESQNGGSGHGYVMNASKLPGGASYGATWAINDVIGIALDLDSTQNTVTFYKNGTSQGGININNAEYVFACSNGQGSSTVTYTYNFGQRAFDYTPPTGFKALNTANLPVPTVKDGTEYFNTVVWSGNGSSPRAITGVGFQPDFIWTRPRTTTDDHLLMDVIRGTGNQKWLSTNSVSAEGIAYNNANVTSLDSDGFTIGTTGGTNQLNATSRSPVAWSWKAGGSGSANTAGSISSTVSVNADAGFSIVKYTGNSTAGATVGHGLGVAPKVVITKSSSTNIGNWGVYHYGVDATSPEDYMLNLNLTNNRTDSPLWWNDTAPSSTVFTVGTSNDVNGSSDYIAYCFAEVEGYSKVGRYTGNGSSDGTFVYTGFKPAFLMIKRTDSSGEWWMYDNARGPINVIPRMLMANNTLVEQEDSASYLMDFLSNGFKWRSGLDASNGNGGSFAFMAFAETPFKHANAR